MIEINSPSKINIGLNIIEKRSDGYHNIETIFYPVKLFDVIKFYKEDFDSFKCNNIKLMKEKNNLIFKAKEILELKFNKKFNLKIELNKNIPIGAGMGGGSSDAASALHSINILYNLNLSKKELNDIAIKLGSDVPFFLDPRPSYASGRGELISLIDFSINSNLLIVNPGIHISTKWAYDNIIPKKPHVKLSEIIKEKIDFEEYKDIFKNDFESVVFKKFPEIESIKNDMYNIGAEFSLMTGSGSTVFGLFKDIGNAKKAAIKFQKKYFTFLQLKD